MIQVRGVSKSFAVAGGAGGGPASGGVGAAGGGGALPGRVLAVRSVTLDVRPGAVTGLLGPNGAGKTTLIRLITGQLTPDVGSVLVQGHDSIVASGPARGCIGYLPESAPLYPEMRVTEYLDFRLRLLGRYAPARGRKARRLAIDRAIERCWLKEMRPRRIGTLSKGYRQRVGLAAAIVGSPAVLVLDEPTTGLDPTQIRAMRDLIRDLARAADDAPQGRVVLLSSHILPEVEQTCDRVLIMARGRLRADGTPRGLTSAADHAAPFEIEVAGELPRMAELATALRAIDGVGRVDATLGKEGSRYRVEMKERGGGGGGGAGADEHIARVQGAIARALHERGLVVRELYRRQPSLEQVFVRVVEAPDDAPLLTGGVGGSFAGGAGALS